LQGALWRYLPAAELAHVPLERRVWLYALSANFNVSMVRHASVRLQRQPTKIKDPWLERLGALPLSPYYFIAGSVATWIPHNNLGKPQLRVPGNMDVLSLRDREQFYSIESDCIRDMKSASASKGLSIDELHQSRICYLLCYMPLQPSSALTYNNGVQELP
jgi:hypothetical protein